MRASTFLRVFVCGCVLVMVAVPVHADLVAEWTFDEGSGQVAYDTSGNGNDAQLGGADTADSGDPTWITDGKSSSALNFSGAHQVETPVNIDPGTMPVMTASAWIRLQTLPDVLGAVISNDDGGYDRAIMVDSSGNYVVFAGRWVSTFVPVTLGEWEHVAATWSSTEVTLFVNGVEAYSEGGETVDFGTTANIGRSHGSGWGIACDIDEVRIWDHAVSDTEIWFYVQSFDPLFDDGFEGGDTSRWSQTVPTF